MKQTYQHHVQHNHAYEKIEYHINIMKQWKMTNKSLLFILIYGFF